MLSQTTSVAVLGFSEPNSDWLRILTSRKSFRGSRLQMLFFGRDKAQLEICLRLQAIDNVATGQK